MPKNILKIAVFFLLGVSVPVGAEVKLRIYLQDGTLQAGTLVSETDDNFVLLSKDGRVEVPKNRIMFVNGKTLKQWQERPDKLFQTEIIPSDIPDPAYVHDKSLPVVAPIEPLKAQEPVPVENKAAALNSVAAQTSVPATPPAPKPVLVEPVKEPVPAVELPKKKEDAPKPIEQTEVRKVAPVVTPLEKKADPKPVVKETARPTAVERPAPIVQQKKEEKVARIEAKPPEKVMVPQGRFDRSSRSAYHLERAQGFLRSDLRGRAIQDLHIATILDRANPQAALLLGKLYVEEGQFTRAEKFLNHPGLRNRSEVSSLRNKAKEVEKSRKRFAQALYASTAAGLLAGIPLLILTRRMRLGKKPALVVTAENLNEANVAASNGSAHFTMADSEVESSAIPENMKVEAPVEENPILPAEPEIPVSILSKDPEIAALVSEPVQEIERMAGAEAEVIESEKPRIGGPLIEEKTDVIPPSDIIEEAPDVASESPVSTTPSVPKEETPVESQPVEPAGLPPRDIEISSVPAAEKKAEEPAVEPLPGVDEAKEIMDQLSSLLSQADAKISSRQIPNRSESEPLEPPRFEEKKTEASQPISESSEIHQPEEPEKIPEPAKKKPQPAPDPEEILFNARLIDRALEQGNVLAGEGKIDLARREYKTALALNPASLNAYLGLGYLCFIQGDLTLALEHYLKAAQIDPASADAHYGIGRIYLETDRTQEAISEMEMVLSLDPTFDDARDSLTAVGKLV